MGVNKEYQHQGIGAILLDFSIRFLRMHKAQSIYVLVEKDNIVAQQLYAKFGFRDITNLAWKNATAIRFFEYSLDTNIAQSQRIQGNAMQRYPKLSLAIGTGFVAVATAVIYIHKLKMPR